MINVWAIVLVILLVLSYLIQARTTFAAAYKDRYTKRPELDRKDTAEILGVFIAGLIWYLFLAVIYGSVIAIALAAINYGR